MALEALIFFIAADSDSKMDAGNESTSETSRVFLEEREVRKPLLASSSSSLDLPSLFSLA